MNTEIERKNVYLFELDSVRNTDEEIICAQEALYNEIVVNGNTVILTYNQLIDSRGFFSLFNDKKYHENLIELFEKGYIKISQYRDVRTLVQYLINSFEYEKQFIYSGWPLKSTQKRLLALIRRSLVYCDLSELRMYLSGEKTDEELDDLFIEVLDETNRKTIESPLSIEDKREILKNLYWLLKVVFTLSIKEHIYVPPRNPKEYDEYKLHNILELVLSFTYKGNEKYWDHACGVISGLSSYQSKKDDRSVYLRELKDAYTKTETSKEVYQYAEAMINICYNYACEISICNTSKHYCFGEIGKRISDGTFNRDFISRLSDYWSYNDLDNRFLLDEDDTFKQFDNKKKLPDFAKAIRFVNYAEEKGSQCLSSLREDVNTKKYVPRYQSDLSNQKKRQKKKINKSIGIQFIIALIAIVIAIGVDVSLMWVQDAYHNVTFSFHRFIPAAFETAFMLFVTELITYFISKRWNRFRSLSEAIGDIRYLLIDFCSAAVNKELKNIDEDDSCNDSSDLYSQGKLIEYIMPREIREYLRLKKTKPELFTPSNQIPIAEIDTLESQQMLMRDEELFNNKYGIVYNSNFNMMCVDPIIDDRDNHSKYYAYERVVPIAGKGVVIVPKHNDNFVMLRQFRHSLRRDQYAFPRGYGERGLTTEQNAAKELQEELLTFPKSEPKYIGSISPDSGLSRTSADVYAVEIDSYSLKKGYEGIKEIVELTEDELNKMIGNNKIDHESLFDDGFSLAAYSLYKESLCG